MSKEKQKILYIEDDPASRRLVERTLLFAGYDVYVAENGLKGLDLARQEIPDLILTDINLPDLSGQEIASTLRIDERFKKTPIVALTAQGHGTREWEMAFAAGVNGYITKPIDVEKLGDLVRYYLEGGEDIFSEDLLVSAKKNYTESLVTRLEGRIRELESVNKELLEMDKIKDTFIELTAHELRTPLTLVYGYSRLLEDNPMIKGIMAQDPTIGELIAGMGDSISRMQGIIGEIVTTSRIMGNHIDMVLSPVDLQFQLQRVIDKYRLAIQERNIKLHVDLPKWKGKLQGDGDLLRTVLENLLSNAMKFTKDNGAIYMDITYASDTVRFSVRDTGIGIDPKNLSKIFERFFTTSDVRLHSTSKTAFKGGGLGLGLAISKGIIEAHGGQIWAESDRLDEDGTHGTTMHVSLPLIPTPRRKQKSV